MKQLFIAVAILFSATMVYSSTFQCYSGVAGETKEVPCNFSCAKDYSKEGSKESTSYYCSIEKHDESCFDITEGTTNGEDEDLYHEKCFCNSNLCNSAGMNIPAAMVVIVTAVFMRLAL